MSGLLNLRRITGIVFILAFIAMLVGVSMFLRRMDTEVRFAQYLTERSFLMTAVVLTAVGLMLLEGYLAETGDRILARIGATLYLIASAVLLTAEGMGIGQARSFDPLFVIYVVIALIAQAIVGAAVIRTKALPVWIGWLIIVWNIGWLIALPIVTPRDMYYPILHHLMPLVIGIGLLVTKASTLNEH